MKKTNQILILSAILSLAFTGCGELLEISFNHILDADMELAFQDYFESNLSDNSIGSSGVTALAEFGGSYVLAYGGSGPALSRTADFITWKHYSDRYFKETSPPPSFSPQGMP